MKRTRYLAVLVVVALVSSALAVSGGQVRPGKQTPDQAPLVVVAEQLRLAIYVSTLAVLSPTIADQRLHTQQVINILEGKGGKDFVPLASSGDEQGLILRVTALFQRMNKLELDPKMRERVRFIAESIITLLNLAREESLRALKSRQLKAGAEEMLKVYAYLEAALGRETAPTYLGGLLMLARLVPLPPDEGGSSP